MNDRNNSNNNSKKYEKRMVVTRAPVTLDMYECVCVCIQFVEFSFYSQCHDLTVAVCG